MARAQNGSAARIGWLTFLAVALVGVGLWVWSSNGDALFRFDQVERDAARNVDPAKEPRVTQVAGPALVPSPSGTSQRSVIRPGLDALSMEEGREVRVLGFEGMPLPEARVRFGAGPIWIELGVTNDSGLLALPDRDMDAAGLSATPRFLAVDHPGHAQAVVRETDEAMQVVHLKPGAELNGQLVFPVGPIESFGDVRVFAWPESAWAQPGLHSELTARIDSDPELHEAHVEGSGAFRLTGLDPEQNYSLRAIGGGWISSTKPNQRPGDGVCQVPLSQVYLLCMETEGAVSLLLDNEYESFGMRVYHAKLLNLSTDKLDAIPSEILLFRSQTERVQLASGEVPLPTNDSGPFRGSSSLLTSVSPKEAAWFCREDLGHRGHRLSFGYGLRAFAVELGALEGKFLVRLGEAQENLVAAFAPVSQGGAVLSLQGKDRQRTPVYRVDLRIRAVPSTSANLSRNPQARVTCISTTNPQDAWVLYTDGTDRPHFWLPAGDYELRYSSAGGLSHSKLIPIKVTEQTRPVVIDWTGMGSIEIEWVDDLGMPSADTVNLLCYPIKGDPVSGSNGGFGESLSFRPATHAPLLSIAHLAPGMYRIETIGPFDGTLISGGVAAQSAWGSKLAFNVTVRASEVARVQVVGH